MVFSAVASELAGCLGVPHARLCRYQADGSSILLAAHHEPAAGPLPVGRRLSFEGENVSAMVLRTGRAARMDSLENAQGATAEYVRSLGLRAAVGVPIVVGGCLWGAAVVGSIQPLPRDTEARVGDFAELVATAIANADARAELTASRARIVAAADGARRRFERNLHDGAQQRLVSLGLQLRIAEAGVPPELPALAEQISDAIAGLTGVSDDLQEISRGSTLRFCPRVDSGQRLKRSPAAPPFRLSSTSPSTDDCPNAPKWPLTTRSPKRSRTRPSTRRLPRCV